MATMTADNTVRSSGECICFISALRASEHLHQVLARIKTHPLDQILGPTRQAATVVQQYSTCSFCTDSSRFSLYAILLRQANECYSALLQRESKADSNTSSQSQDKTIKIQIGAFEIDAPLDAAFQAVILSEIKHSTNAVSELEAILQPGGIKGAKEMWDKTTWTYQHSLVVALKNDLSKTRDETLKMAERL